MTKTKLVIFLSGINQISQVQETGLSNRVNLIEGIAYTGDRRTEKQNRMVRQPRNHKVSVTLEAQGKELTFQTLVSSILQCGYEA